MNDAVAAQTIFENAGATQRRIPQATDGLEPAVTETAPINVPVELMKVIRRLNSSVQNGYQNRAGSPA